MPPVIGFQTYLSNARMLVSQDAQSPRNGGARPADRILGLKGHTITAVSGNAPVADVERARQDFIDSFVEQFGEGCRTLVESALLGQNAKPLTARMIMSLNEQALALKPSDLTASLSDLLRRAAQADAGGVTHEQFQALLQANPELRAELEPLNDVRKQTEEALTRLGAFKGSEIAAAFRPGAAASAQEQAVKDAIHVLVRTAVDKLFDLADGLRRLYGRHGDAAGMLFGMVTRCNNRALEVQRMVIELSQLDAASDDARLSMYAAELLPRLALQMHGTGRALAHLRVSLQPLADRFDAIRAAAARDGNVGLQDVALLLREISVARAALDEAARRGIKMPEGDIERPDPGLFRALDALLAKLQSDVNQFTADALEERAKNWVRGVVPTFSATKLFTVYREVVKDVSDDAEEMERFLLEMEAFRQSALAWAQGLSNIATLTILNDSYQHLGACMRAFRLASQVVDALRANRSDVEKREARAERLEELKEKVADLRERFQKLGDARLRELEAAADADREELEKMQNLLEEGPSALNAAAVIQRLYDMLVGRREESQEDREADGSGV